MSTIARKRKDGGQDANNAIISYHENTALGQKRKEKKQKKGDATTATLSPEGKKVIEYRFV